MENIKRKLIRAAIAVVWIALGTVIFILARGHSLLLDNRNVEAPEIRAQNEVVVSVDGKDGIKLLRGDRDRLTVKGSKHTIRVEFKDGKEPFEGNFFLPLKGDMYLLSVTKMINGIDPFVEVFQFAPESRNAAPEEEEEADAGF